MAPAGTQKRPEKEEEKGLAGSRLWAPGSVPSWPICAKPLPSAGRTGGNAERDQRKLGWERAGASTSGPAAAPRGRGGGLAGADGGLGTKVAPTAGRLGRPDG